MDYAFRNYMYMKGPGPSNLSGLDENLYGLHMSGLSRVASITLSGQSRNYTF